MIRHEWRDELTGDEFAAVRELVVTAAAYDADAGFAVLDGDGIRAAPPGRRVWHLPVTARERLGGPGAPWVHVAHLRLVVDADGQGTVGYTVHPEYRSRGITTLLVEELGLDIAGPAGWCGTGATALRCWAYGTHPAAQRLTRRFGIRPAARLWTLLRPLTGPFAAPLDDLPVPDGFVVAPADTGDTARIEALAARSVTGVHAERFAADFADRHGRILLATRDGRDAGFAWFDPGPAPHAEWTAGRIKALMVAPAARGLGLGSALLTRALHEVAAGGAQVALLRVDPDERAAVRMCRLRSFEQEQAHTCYDIGKWATPPEFASA
ncbi:GNAT family N-acetyltransferase [Nocardia sp. BMG111209]|uniref:GNAT family N-acetyltransferase n=1 Tax=Nocardia sp. BMG111209 TaxID=1160137 RepID=UPI00035FF061|nr:GNAT family N-acetyltransferase [Nocardia sp. BMG111209]